VSCAGIANRSPGYFIYEKNTMKSEHALLWKPFLGENKRETAFLILVGFFSSYCTLLLPLSIGKYLEIAFQSGGAKTKALQLLGINLPGNFTIFFLFFFALVLTKLAVNWLYQYRLAIFGQKFITELRDKLFSHQLLNRGEAAIRPSKLLAYNTESKGLERLVTKGIIGFVKDLMLLLTGFYVLLSLNAALTAFVVVMLTLSWYLQRLYANRQKTVFSEKRKQQGALFNAIANSLLDSSVNSEDGKRAVSGKHEKLSASLNRYHLRKAFIRESAPFMMYIILGTVMILMMSVAWRNHLQPGDVVAYLLLLMTLFPTIRSILRVEYVWMQGNLSARKFRIPLAAGWGATQSSTQATVVPDPESASRVNSQDRTATTELSAGQPSVEG
jgi:ABC-type multidrug transport system fused ATPase/permease subunit